MRKRRARPGARHAATTAISMLALVAGMVHGTLQAPAAQAATDKLPDLQAARLTDMRIETRDGRRLLRFTGMMWNRGAGPFELRANRTSTSQPWRVDQIVYDTSGSFRRIRTAATMQYAGDGHAHWHVKNVMTTHLFNAGATEDAAKIGFCFFDTNHVRPSLSDSPSGPRYDESMCADRLDTFSRNGISVGWGDKYQWSLPLQWVDITGLPGGTYTIRAAVNLFRQFTESSYSNTCAWARIKFGSTGSTVTVLDEGLTCINDLTGHPYAADAAWAIERGITTNCAGDMFCPNAELRRDQAAALVSRARQAPATDVDAFGDDERSPYEVHINRLAALGAAPPCGEERFCPSQPAARARVAAMIAGAFDLPPTTRDYFDDDDGRPSEDAINRLAAAGAATPCGERRFCPDRTITRIGLVRMLSLGSQRGFPDP